MESIDTFLNYAGGQNGSYPFTEDAKIGFEMTNHYYYNENLKGSIGIVIGSEGFGMSKLVKENADILIKIPMKGKITSLNASVSAGIVIYEALKQR